MRGDVEQFGQINPLVDAPPSGSPFITVVFNELERSEFLQMVVEVVPVDTHRLLKLNGAHFLGTRQGDVGFASRRVGECRGDGVASYSSHSPTNVDEGCLGFEDVPLSELWRLTPWSVNIVHGTKQMRFLCH